MSLFFFYLNDGNRPSFPPARLPSLPLSLLTNQRRTALLFRIIIPAAAAAAAAAAASTTHRLRVYF